MTVKTKSGRVLNAADVDRIAAKLEAGFPASAWKPRPGRPHLALDGNAHSPRIAVRVPEKLREQVLARAKTEGKSLSQTLRGLLEEYVRPRRATD